MPPHYMTDDLQLLVERIVSDESLEDHDEACRVFCNEVLPQHLWQDFSVCSDLTRDGIRQHNPELIAWGGDEMRRFIASFQDEFKEPFNSSKINLKE